MTESTPNVGKWRAIPRKPRLIEAHATVLVCDDFGVDARLVLDGDFASDGERDAYVKQLLARLNEPSPKRREAIEADMRRGSRLTTHRLAVGNFGKPQTPPAQSPTPAVDDVKEPSPFYAAPQASADAELRTAFNEWQDKTVFIQEWIQSGKLPVKHLGRHRADVMRDLLEDATLAPQPAEGDVVLPPLPEALSLQPGQRGHTDQTLDCFARAAVLADRLQRAPLASEGENDA